MSLKEGSVLIEFYISDLLAFLLLFSLDYNIAIVELPTQADLNVSDRLQYFAYGPA